ncbi:MAG: family 20 glycosylhydrolase [Kiritimatiellae bacterium]|nr:family 20 glycosylhydrolase [Kiritimatiellia bacterium]
MIRSLTAFTMFLTASVALAASPRLRLGWEFCITHGKTPTIETAKRLIAIVADLGYEEIHLFSKAAFLYEKHPEPSRDRSPYTWADVRELDDFCAAKGIELVPYQASFSHMEPWLATPEYRSLAEAPEAGVKTRWKSATKIPMGLCASDPRTLPFLEELWDELLPNFRSRKFNVGCDEFIEYDDGGRRSAAAVKERGALTVYTDYLRQMNDAIRRRGRTMMCWADIVLHNPEAVDLVPKDVVLLDWGYEATHPFAKECSVLEKSGHKYWVCPGTSGWNSFVGRVANMKGNVAAAWREGTAHGAEGLLLTTWGDGGHPQPWLVELPGLVYAAACVRENKELSDEELSARIDRICGCRCGETLIRWGNLYRLCAAKHVGNWSNLAIILRHRGKSIVRPNGVTDAMIAAVAAERRAAREKLDLTGAPAWVRDDVKLMELLLDAVEWRAQGDHDRVVRELPGPYAELWLKQNRPGGLETSIELNLMQSEPWARMKMWN